MDMSNKALAFLLVVAIVVSVWGTTVSLSRLGGLQAVTGRATDTDIATANITIQGSISINFVASEGRNLVNFGSGFTNDSGAGIQTCTIDTNGTDPSGDCVSFNSGLLPLVIENTGNSDVNLSLSSDSNATDLLGGTVIATNFSWYTEENESGSCNGALGNGDLNTTWVGINKTTFEWCAQATADAFNYENANDQLNLHFRVIIPEDATPGTRTATITATAND